MRVRSCAGMGVWSEVSFSPKLTQKICFLVGSEEEILLLKASSQLLWTTHSFWGWIKGNETKSEMRMLVPTSRNQKSLNTLLSRQQQFLPTPHRVPWAKYIPESLRGKPVLLGTLGRNSRERHQKIPKIISPSQGLGPSPDLPLPPSKSTISSWWCPCTF